MKKSCFVSYSYDSKEHELWVLRLVKKLNKGKRIDVFIDKTKTRLGSDLLDFMVDSITKCDSTLLICTPKYKAKVNGGAALEKMLIGSKLMSEALTHKFIPVLREGDKVSSIPDFLQTKRYIEMKGSFIKQKDVEEIITSVRKQKSSMTLKSRKRGSRSIVSRTLIDSTDTSRISRIKLAGYTLLGGRGADGIRYIWKTAENWFIDSVAFNSRLRSSNISQDDRRISAYTTSVSFGCGLRPMKATCRFCATGTIPFRGPLTAEEIALQNIFMASYDNHCPSWPDVRTNKREFAFMGQGEPGLHYPAIKEAILLTDRAMAGLEQQIHRYIIASCGIPDFLDAMISDILNKVFANKVTLHFSLNAVDSIRTDLMPINRIYPYENFLLKSKEYFEKIGEKIAVGILLFDNFIPRDLKTKAFSTEKYIEQTLSILDPRIHRIDLCDVNHNKAINTQHEMSNEIANKLLDFVRDHGFEAKLFSSFGTDKSAGCGTLISSRTKMQSPGKLTQEAFANAISILQRLRLTR